jgi:hypothetical protein
MIKIHLMEGAWVDRWEKNLGWLAVPGLPGFAVGMTGASGALALFKPELLDRLVLAPTRILSGEVWRAVTFLIVPPFLPGSLPGLLWFGLWLWMMHGCLQTLEHAWGEFKLTVFVALGAAAIVVAALALGAACGDSVVVLACFLALARLFPEREVILLFLPVKLRWLAVLAAVLTFVDFVTGSWTARAGLAAGLFPYLVFFASGHWRDLELAWRRRARP